MDRKKIDARETWTRAISWLRPSCFSWTFLFCDLLRFRVGHFGHVLSLDARGAKNLYREGMRESKVGEEGMELITTFDNYRCRQMTEHLHRVIGNWTSDVIQDRSRPPIPQLPHYANTLVLKMRLGRVQEPHARARAAEHHLVDRTARRAKLSKKHVSRLAYICLQRKIIFWN